MSRRNTELKICNQRQLYQYRCFGVGTVLSNTVIAYGKDIYSKSTFLLYRDIISYYRTKQEI
jgi:hypothetical protein